jgi:hypothetical protein
MEGGYGIGNTGLTRHAFGCKEKKEKGRIFVPVSRVVLQGNNDKYNFIRMPHQGLFHRFANYQILAGYIAAYQLIDDDELRYTCCDTLCLGSDFKYSMKCFLEWNNGYINNIADILMSINPEQKQAFFDAISEAVPEKYQKFSDFIDEIYPYLQTTMMKQQ